jgi:hypothetical protein
MKFSGYPTPFYALFALFPSAIAFLTAIALATVVATADAAIPLRCKSVSICGPPFE